MENHRKFSHGSQPVFQKALANVSGRLDSKKWGRKAQGHQQLWGNQEWPQDRTMVMVGVGAVERDLGCGASRT